MSTIFISDIHLEPGRPDITALFERCLQETCTQKADALYILGDLFEFWLGDDDNTPFADTIKSRLRETSRLIPTYIMQGNRDFLLGQRFMRDTNCTLLDDPCVIDLYGKPTLLMHGDLLCTLDTKYQAYRRKIRNPWIQRAFTTLPLWCRQKIAHLIRAKSQAHTKVADSHIMDACQDAIESLMSLYGTELLIHGHTHKPTIHFFRQKQNDTFTQRIVLSDWHARGNVLRYEPDHRFRLVNFR